MAEFSFQELKKVPRGTLFDPEVNVNQFEAVRELCDADAIELFKLADKNKWYGTLYVPENHPVVEAVFQYGVCQFIRLIHRVGQSCFKITVPNGNVYFKK